MEMTKGLLSILLTAILTNNYILAKFLGICPFLGVSKKLNTAMGMSAAVIFVMSIATAVTYPINMFLVSNNLEYLQTIVFILVIAALVQLVEIILKKYIPALYSALGIYLPLITTNCAVLGVVLLNIDSGFGFAESMVNSVGACFQVSVKEWNQATFPSLCADFPLCLLPLHLCLFPSSDLRALLKIFSIKGR